MHTPKRLSERRLRTRTPMRLSMRIVIALTLVVTALATTASAQTALDRQVRRDYEAVEKLLDGVSGDDVKDDVRRAAMGRFQTAAKTFVDKYEGQVARLGHGRFDLGRAYLHLARPQRAAAHLEAFLRAYPAHADATEATLILGDMYRATNRLGEATALYEKFISAHPSHTLLPEAYLGLATTHYFNLRPAAAVAAYDHLLARYPDHRSAADAAVQSIDALVDAGRADDARKRIDKLLIKEPEAPHLKDLKRVVRQIGRTAPDLRDVATWVGPIGSNVSRFRGRVLVLCFFANWSARCAWELQYLSRLQTDLETRGLTVWGVTKTYKAGKKDWTVAKEANWLQRYRQNPRDVLERELRSGAPSDAAAREKWEELSRPIRVPFALTTTSSTLRDYAVRGVPCIVVIDKQGRIQLMKEGGGPADGFQRRLIRRKVEELLDR